MKAFIDTEPIIETLRSSLQEAMAAIDDNVARLATERDRLAQALAIIEGDSESNGNGHATVGTVVVDLTAPAEPAPNGNGKVTAVPPGAIDPTTVSIKEFCVLVLRESEGTEMTAQQVVARMLALGWNPTTQPSGQVSTVRATLSQLCRLSSSPVTRHNEGLYFIPRGL